MDASRPAATAAVLVTLLALTTACGRARGSDPGAGATTGSPVSSRPVGSATSREAGDYRITASEPRQCDWVADERGTIHIGGYFIGAYEGPDLTPATIPYYVSDNVDANSATGYAGLGPAHFSLPVATRPVAYTYVLTVSLHPPGGDQKPGNDSASLSIEIPVGTPLTVPEPLPCS